MNWMDLAAEGKQKKKFKVCALNREELNQRSNNLL